MPIVLPIPAIITVSPGLLRSTMRFLILSITLSPASSISLHRSNRLQTTLLDDDRVDWYVLLRSFLFNLETFRPNTPDSGTDTLTDLTCGLALELQSSIYHHDHRDLPIVLL